MKNSVLVIGFESSKTEVKKEKFINEKAKNIILTSIMYNMTWHINTSGTMKGFHNGWGGKGGKAKERIMGDIKLKNLPFVESELGTTFNDYAEKVFSNNDLGEMDIIYADPPYNQHQYSANYNHLTTICRNDKYNPGKVVQGSRAGIRVDHTRSDFCKSTKSKDEAEGEQLKLAEKAFIDFIKNVKAKYIVMSYNNEGVVSIDRLMDLMRNKEKNKVEVTYKIHDKFKGGKATQTSNKVMEYLIIIEQNKNQTAEEYNEIKESLLSATEKHLFLDKYINYKTINNNYFEVEELNELVTIKKQGKSVLSINKKTYKVTEENLSLLDKKEIQEVMVSEVDNLKLIELYIENHSIELAESLLPVFKIKKYQKQQKEFIEKINKLKEERL